MKKDGKTTSWKIAFVALMEKMIDKILQDKHCKGTKQCVVAEGFTIDVYKTYLCDGKTKYREKMLFENKKHEAHIVDKHKINLRKEHDIRRVGAYGITTLGRGYVA